MVFERSEERKKLRLSYWDYSLDGYYFVTICTKNMNHFFGEIQNGIMGLNELGIIANECWLDIVKHFSDVRLNQYVVMPNHVHGIIIIGQPSIVGDADLRPLPYNRTKMFLPKIIHGFKSTVTRQINKLYPDSNFHWQRSYYDHIIYNEKEFDNICNYIYYNPWKWECDRNNSENLWI